LYTDQEGFCREVVKRGTAMIRFPELLEIQKQEAAALRTMVELLLEEKIKNESRILGALLTGSVARGDARIGPFGVMVDLALVVDKKEELDLETMFGKDEEPDIPFHCVSLKDTIGLAIEVLEEKELYQIRQKQESQIFSKHESIILYDPSGLLRKWKEQYFIIDDNQVRQRALQHYYRFCYLTGDYRFEKWEFRKAYTQINQNFNEAAECYCNFLHCINRSFIPRKDWLAYLTYELQIKPADHETCMAGIYEASNTEEGVLRRNGYMEEIRKWMNDYCIRMKWVG
jgi:predicted nucleotidyltransferase